MNYDIQTVNCISEGALHSSLQDAHDSLGELFTDLQLDMCWVTLADQCGRAVASLDKFCTRCFSSRVGLRCEEDLAEIAVLRRSPISGAVLLQSCLLVVWWSMVYFAAGVEQLNRLMTSNPSHKIFL